MRCVFPIGLAVLAAACALQIGCRTETTHPATAASPAGENAAQQQAEAHAHYAAAVIHDMNGETGAALDDFYQAALGDPTNEVLVLQVSRTLLEHDQADKAAAVLSRVAANPDASGLVFVRLGFARLQLKQIDEAREASRLAVKKTPSDLAGYQNWYLSCVLAKQGEAAIKVLDQASRAPGTGTSFLIGLAQLYANCGLQFPSNRSATRAGELAALQRAAGLAPSDVPTQLKLADGLSSLGRAELAAPLYHKVLGQISNDPALQEAVRARLADIYLRGLDRTNARAQLEAIVRRDPGNGRAYFYLGSLAYDEKNWPAATDYFQKALLFAPDLEPAYYDLAATQIAGDDSAAALATLEKARGKFPQSFLQEYLSAAACMDQKRYAEATRHFTAAEVVARAQEPKRLTGSFFYQAGAAFERNGDYGPAEENFQKSLKLNPNLAEAMNYLGYMWAERGIKLEPARHLIQKALKLEPDNAAYLDSMGWVLFKLNRPKEALDYLLQAKALLPTPDATVYDHLGDVYAALRQDDRAREAWRTSLSAEPDPQVKKKLDAAGR